MRRKKIPILVLLSILSSLPFYASSSSSVFAQDQPKRIKVMGTGKAVGMPILAAWFTTEPSTDPIIIPTRETSDVTPEAIRRFMRIYYPRAYKDLLKSLVLV